MSKVYVNIESSKSLDIWLVTLTIGKKHFIDNQYKSKEDCLRGREYLLNNFEGFEIGYE